MKTDRVKKLILLVLSLVVIYVWYGNVQLFTGGTEDEGNVAQQSRRQETFSSEVGAQSELSFVEPRVNPFEPVGSLNNPSSTIAQPAQTAKPIPQSPRRISADYRLTGAVVDGSRSHASMSDTRGRQFLLTRGDTLGEWVVRDIRENRIEFASGAYRDTLSLHTVSLGGQSN